MTCGELQHWLPRIMMTSSNGNFFFPILPFVWGIHWLQVNSPHRGQWRGALMFSLICAWINAWVYSREAGDLRRHRASDDVIVMRTVYWQCNFRTNSTKTVVLAGAEMTGGGTYTEAIALAEHHTETTQTWCTPKSTHMWNSGNQD